MEIIKANMSRMNALLNNGERIQKSIFGSFLQSVSYEAQAQKGILCATNERLYFFPENIDLQCSKMDYYKIEAIDFIDLPKAHEMAIHYNGSRHTMSFIEEGDAGDFNHFVLDRMEIKS